MAMILRSFSKKHFLSMSCLTYSPHENESTRNAVLSRYVGENTVQKNSGK